MKILIVGSLRDPDPGKPDNHPSKLYVKQNTENYRVACKALGKALANRGHTIMVGVPNWATLLRRKTPATFVVQGANEADPLPHRLHKVIFYEPEVHEPKDKTPNIVDTIQDLRNLQTDGKIKIKEIFIGTGSSSAREIPNVAEVDSVMLISGREGTEYIGYAAYSMGKPIIAVKSFGGAAQRISEEVLGKKYQQCLDKGDVTTEDLKALDVEWNTNPKDADSNANAVVKTSEKLVKAFCRSILKTRLVLGGTVAFMVLLLLGWLFLFMSAAQCTPANLCDAFVNKVLFGLLYISALLGTGLRTMVSYQSNELACLDGWGEIVDGVIALLIAFGLSLIYLIGGITFTGTVVAVGNGAGIGFATVAISMSLIGLAAGYLVPLSALSDYLKKLIPQEK
jgi:hypothetical protein